MKWQDRPRWQRWGVELGIVVMIFLAIRAWQQQDHVRGELPITQFISVQQNVIDLAQWQGQSLLLHFSASWCPICRLMQDAIVDISKDHPVITVLVQMSDEEVNEWLAAHPEVDQAMVVRDDDGRLLNAFGGRALPMDMVIFDGKQIVFSEQGFSSQVGLRIRLWLAQY